MTTLSSPSSRSSSPSHEAEKPASLDTLLERYLHLLDGYTILKDKLSKDFSSGFFSLAQANFDAPSHIRHYGQDQYDERMQACLRAEILPESNSVTFTPKILPTTSSTKRKESKGKPPKTPEDSSLPSPSPSTEPSPSIPAKPTSPPATAAENKEKDKDPAPLPSPGPSSATPPSPANGELEKEPTQAPSPPLSPSPLPTEALESSPEIRDPIRQFGLLVPPALRAAQGSFKQGVEEGVFELVGVEREMRVLEEEIRGARLREGKGGEEKGEEGKGKEGTSGARKSKGGTNGVRGEGEG